MLLSAELAVFFLFAVRGPRLDAQLAAGLDEAAASQRLA
jgi:hypothetical protein